MNNITPIELIEKYLQGELRGAELAAIEKRLATEPEFAKEVAQYEELINAIKAHGKEAAFRSKLKSIHRELDVSQLRRVEKARSRTRRLPEFIATGAIAAGVALLIMMGVGRWIVGGQEQDNGIQELVGQMDELTERVNAMDSSFYQQNPEVKSMDVSFGTAFPISSNGYLITSHHIVKKADRIFIELPGSKRYRAKMVYSDPTTDLAVLKTEDTNFVSFGRLPYSFDTKDSRLGEYVYTMGYSKEDVVFTEGSISSLTGFNEDTSAYQVSVPANPGNSGGPVLDEQGHILGLLSGKHSQQEGAAFATKSGYILTFLDEMKSDAAFADLSLPKGRTLKRLTRADQVQKLESFIFKVRVYSK